MDNDPPPPPVGLAASATQAGGLTFTVTWSDPQDQPHRSKTVALKHGRLTVVFRLGPRTAAHALVRVSARLDHELAVTSTLRRQPRRSSAKGRCSC